MKKFFIFVGVITFLFGASFFGQAYMDLSASTENQEIPSYSLEDCLKIALEKNQWRPASQLAVEVAEAQHKQALSSLWPRIDLRSSVMLMDEDPNFLFPAQSFALDFPTLAGPMSIPITIPEMDIQLMDKFTVLNSVNLAYPLLTSGLRSGIIKQAKAGVEAARQASRRTDLKVIYDVKKYYFACVLAKKLHKTGSDALARLNVTLELTENLYKKGSGRVKKTDFLRNKIVVEGLRSMVAVLKSNVELAKAALVNTMGLEWNTAIDVADDDIPYNPYDTDVGLLVSNTYEFNPDWAQLKAGLDAAEAKIQEAQSGYYPKIGLVGSLNYMVNSYDAGMATPKNKTNWMVGLGLEIPLFNGFFTKGKVSEAKARLAKLEKQQILLQEGLALKVKHIYLQIVRAREQQDASKAAKEAAEQNRDLNVRAYQDELVETQDVVEAQILESLMLAQYYKILYDHVEAQAHLDFLIGEEVNKLLR